MASNVCHRHNSQAQEHREGTSVPSYALRYLAVISRQQNYSPIQPVIPGLRLNDLPKLNFVKQESVKLIE
jgi:hypothetical protein